jgi:metal-responsive CopG/Arc/MetJ family transcriptional regulator
MKAKKSRMGRPPLSADTAFYGVRMPASLMAEVDRRAKAEGVTRSEMLRRLVAAGLAVKGGKR